MTLSLNRKAIGAAALSVVLTAGTIGYSYNAFGATNINARLTPDFTIIIDGDEKTFFSASGEEVHPIVYKGTTYLPLRAIGELMGKNVNWDESTLTVSISGTRTTGNVKGTVDKNADEKTVSAQIRDDFKIVVDGVTETFKDADGNRVYPILYNGSTYLPLRSIGELMGKTVSWNADTETITLSSASGTVTDADSFNNTSSSNTSSTSNGSLISVETAKSKALNHSGESSGSVTFVKAKLEWEDGRQVYEVEFYTKDYKEYDYEIDARTGEILSYDYDAENYSYKAPSSSSNYIGEAKAKSIALGQVSGASQNNVAKVEFDIDDGRAEYEVKIIYNEMEHEFEIDAVTGSIISRDTESIYD